MQLPTWVDRELSRDLAQLRSRGESQDTEYMVMFPSNAHELAKEIAAFATSNQGTILIGVTNEGDLIGIQNMETPSGRDELLNRLQGICNGAVRPSITPLVKFAMENGKVVLCIVVPKGSQPVYYCHEKPYLRHLTESRPAQPHEVIELVSRWTSVSQRSSPESGNPKSEVLSSLASILVDVLIFAEEATQRIVNPWFDMWRAQFLDAAGGLGRLLGEDGAQEADLQQDVSQLRAILEETATFPVYMGAGPEIERRVAELKQAAFKLKEKYIDPIPLDSMSRKSALGDIKRFTRQIADLSARAAALSEQGRDGEIVAEASRIGYQLLRLSAYAGVLPDEESRTIVPLARRLHLAEAKVEVFDGGRSISALIGLVAEATAALSQIVGSL